MKELSYKGYSGTVEVSIEDGCLHGRILFIDDIITYEGETVKEIESAFKEAVDDYLAYCEKTGKPANKPYSGTFNVRIGPELHKLAAIETTRRGMKSINEFICYAVKMATDSDLKSAVSHVHYHDITISVRQAGEAIAFSSMGQPVYQEICDAIH